MLALVDNGAHYLTRTGGNLWFISQVGRGGTYNLWRTDGTAENTRIIINDQAMNGPDSIAVLGNTVYYSSWPCCFDGIRRITMNVDGTATQGYLELPTSAAAKIRDASQYVTVEDHLYFVAEMTSGGYELWTSDGTSNGTTSLSAGLGDAPQRFLTVEPVCDQLMFVTSSQPTSTEEKSVWITDGTAEGTRMIATMGEAYFLGKFEQTLLFMQYSQYVNIVILNCTSGTSSTVQTGAAGWWGPVIHVGGIMYFQLQSNGINSWWTSDGTVSGTRAFDESPIAEVLPIFNLFGMTSRIVVDRQRTIFSK